MNMSKQLFKKLIVGVTIFLLLGAGLSSVSIAKETEEKQSDSLILTKFPSDSDGNKILFLDENKFSSLKNSISDCLTRLFHQMRQAMVHF